MTPDPKIPANKQANNSIYEVIFQASKPGLKIIMKIADCNVAKKHIQTDKESGSRQLDTCELLRCS